MFRVLVGESVSLAVVGPVVDEIGEDGRPALVELVV